MAPKKAAAQEDPEENAEDDKTAPIWVYGANDHLDVPKELPPGFKSTGFLCKDYLKLCKAVGASPHPALRPKPKPPPPPERLPMRRPSQAQIDLTPPAPPPFTEGPNLCLRSMLVDSTSMQLLGLLLPMAVHIRVLSFSDCRLDLDMLKLIRRGLSGSSSVESLQIDWNPLELPLPTVEDMEALAAASRAEASEDAEAAEGAAAPADSEAAPSRAGGFDAADTSNLEFRERHRYLLQSQRVLRNFGDWLLYLVRGESLDQVWAKLAQADVDTTALLGASDFYDAIEAHLGARGPQVAEVFEVLDGPDHGGGQGRYSFQDLRAALEGLPPELEAAAPDLIGTQIATFMDGECVVESLSVRSSAVGRLELGPIASALARCPWQLRSLNLWENRVCDRGAKLLADALVEYRGLQYLGLGRNRITDKGFTTLVTPFNLKVLDEAGAKVAKDEIKAQEGRRDAAAKAKAKAKATPSGGRERRQPSPNIVDDLEDGPEGEGQPPTWVLRKPSELKTIVFSENPIIDVSTVEAAQPLGPRGAELLLKKTGAAAGLLAKRPELGEKEKRDGKPPAGQRDSAPGLPEGWVLRLF